MALTVIKGESLGVAFINLLIVIALVYLAVYAINRWVLPIGIGA